MPGCERGDLGIAIGRGTPGPNNAITDVAGVTVGHTTLIEGEGPRGWRRTDPHGRDRGRARTGSVRALLRGLPQPERERRDDGLEWIREAGQLGGPIGLTNTHSIGVVHDALIDTALAIEGLDATWWFLPVVGEIFDGDMNDINGFHVRAEHVRAALDAAAAGPVAEGNVGGGTGAISFDFKGGIGTASRVIEDRDGGYTVGALVQNELAIANGFGSTGCRSARSSTTTSCRARTGRGARAVRVDGTATGGRRPGQVRSSSSSRPTRCPHQCERLAQRAGLGLARTGSIGGHTSGDLFLCFATGNKLIAHRSTEPAYAVTMLDDDFIDPLFMATVESTEEAVINALVAAETMTGRDGHTAHALPHDLLQDTMARYARGR